MVGASPGDGLPAPDLFPPREGFCGVSSSAALRPAPRRLPPFSKLKSPPIQPYVETLINQNSAHFVRVSSCAVRAPRSAKSFRTPYPIACPSRPGLIDTRPSAAAGGPARCLRELASVFPAHGPRAGPKGCAGCAGMEAAAAETHRDPATHCPARLSREVLREPTRRRVGIGTPRSYHGSERGAQTRDNLRLSRVRNRGLKSTITPAYHRVRNPVITGSDRTSS